MVNKTIALDLKHIWHPCMQMKDFESYLPLDIRSAQGVYLNSHQGPVIDAISSWWCKPLGHRHPAIIDAIVQQLTRFEHVMGADCTYEGIAQLGKKLYELTGMPRVFFASDGSSAVEISLKIALQAQTLKGNPQKKTFIALKGAYHGETLGALSVSDLGLYKKAYVGLNAPCHVIEAIPYVLDELDPLWKNCDAYWQVIEPQLLSIKDKACAIIVEPLVQGAAGMKIYSADFLRRLRQFAITHDIYFIADEIMTGIGRVGEWLALDKARACADLICLSKGLTAGALPLSAVLMNESLYQLFYNDYEKGQSFLHSHTHSGNALAVSAALASLNTLQELDIKSLVATLNIHMQDAFKDIASCCQKLNNIRNIGAIIAADLVKNPKEPRLGFKLHKEALARGALLRPIGDTLYWLPPLITDKTTIGKLAEITLDSINACYQ